MRTANGFKLVLVLFVVLTGSQAIRTEERVILGEPANDGSRPVVAQWDYGGEKSSYRCGPHVGLRDNMTSECWACSAPMLF